MFDSLLVPLDGSELAEQAIDEVVALAKLSGAKIHFVRVHASYPEPFGISGEGLVGASDLKWDAHLRRRERAYLAVAARHAKERAGRAIGVHMLDGFAPAAICTCAADLPSPMIVMSTHGHTGLSRAWLGSVADSVVRAAPCPVLLVRSGARSKPSRAAPRILVPLDGSQASEAVIPVAAAVARLAGAEIVLISVAWDGSTSRLRWLVSDPGTIEEMRELADQEQIRIRGYLARIEARMHRTLPDVRVRSRVARGDQPATAIIRAAAKERVGMIAMTSHGRGASRFVLGSIIDKVMRGAQANMLIVRRSSRQNRSKRPR